MADVAEKERRILVAVDEGEESMYALSWCLGNVVSSKDTLILVYVKPPKAVYMPLDGTGRSQSSSGIFTTCLGLFIYGKQHGINSVV